MAALPLMKLIRLKGVPILQQLHLEERLLRTSPHNWCIINDGTNLPHIVMGISGYFSFFTVFFFLMGVLFLYIHFCSYLSWDFASQDYECTTLHS